MKRSFKVLTFCLLALGHIALFAQAPLQRTYTVNDGMAMTESLDVAQDPLGYIWATSTNGRLSRFDGLSWKAYPPEVQLGILNVLSDQQILGYQQTPHGENNHTILRGDSLLRIEGLPKGVVHAVNYSTNGYYYFSSLDAVFRVNPISLAIDSIFKFSVPPSNFNVVYTRVLPNGSIIAGGVSPGRYNKEYYISGPEKGTEFNKTPYRYLTPVGPDYFLGRAIGEPIMTLYNKDQEPIQNLDFSSYCHPNGGINGLVFLNGQYYIVEYILRGGKKPINKMSIHRWSPDNPTELTTLATFNRTSTTGNFWTVSSDGSLWATGHSGLRRLFPGTKAFYESDPEMITALHAVGQLPSGEVLMGGYGSGFSVYRGDTLSRLTSSPWNSTYSVMPGSYRTEEGELIFGLDNEGTMLLTTGLDDVKSYMITNSYRTKPLAGYHFSKAKLPGTSPALKKRSGSQDSVDILIHGLVGTSSSQGSPRFGQFALIELPLSEPPNHTIIDQTKGIKVRNILCTTQDKAGRIWFGHGSTGIGIYDPARDTATTWEAELANDPGAISMVIDKKDRLWLAGRDGLYYINNASSIELQQTPHLRTRTQKSKIRAIPQSYISSLLLKGDTLIIGHSGGVSIIDTGAENVLEPPTKTLNFLEYGLGACEQNALFIGNNGTLWVGVDGGAVNLDFNVLGRGRGVQKLVTRAVEGNTGPLPPNEDGRVKFPLADRSLIYGYDLPIAEQLAGNIKGDFLLLNKQGDTLAYQQNIGSGERLQYPYLPPSQYSLIQDFYANNEHIEQLETTITIPPTLPERWWFFPSIIVAITLPIILGLRNRAIRSKAKLNEEKLLGQITLTELKLVKTQREKDRLQVSTLAGTINPHFISNAIEWLQSAYLVKRPIERMDEMAENLSDVIRMIFTKSFDEKPCHSLKDELSLVERYLRTVNIQYEEAYDFRLPSAQDLAPIAHNNVLLMQLQVHVENAIEHGLRFRKDANQIIIRFNQDDGYIYLIVEDNGAGVEYTKKKHAELYRRKGVGTRIMANLQNTFNQYNSLPLQTTVESPITKDEIGTPYGTRVTISIPKHYTYDIKNIAS